MQRHKNNHRSLSHKKSNDNQPKSRKELRADAKKAKKVRNNSFYVAKKERQSSAHKQVMEEKKARQQSAEKAKRNKSKSPDDKHSKSKSTKSAKPEKTVKAVKTPKVEQTLGKRTTQVKRVEDKAFKDENQREIDEIDKEIKELERKMGLRTDGKRRKRMNDALDKEGMGLGFMSFLDDIDGKARLDINEYIAPKDEYKFNQKEFETALGESDIEGMVDGEDANQVVDDSDQQDFDDYDIEAEAEENEEEMDESGEEEDEE